MSTTEIARRQFIHDPLHADVLADMKKRLARLKETTGATRQEETK